MQGGNMFRGAIVTMINKIYKYELYTKCCYKFLQNDVIKKSTNYLVNI